MGEHKSYLRYLDHCHRFLAYHFFATSAETERNSETDAVVWNKIFHALTVTAFHYMPLDKRNGILTMTLKSYAWSPYSRNNRRTCLQSCSKRWF